MNKFAFRTTGLLVKALYNLSKARFNLHGQENIPEGPVIFVVNHFTRLETFLFPYVVHTLIKKPLWSLASADLFRGAFGEYLEKVGAVSNKAPNRDQLIVNSLLTGNADWIIFPEGRMVKNKKIVEKGKFIISYAGGKHPPHTGAATLALRTEFYRKRILSLASTDHQEAERLMSLFQIDGIDDIRDRQVVILPVNISYYPLRARENILSKLAVSLMENLPEKILEELMTEGSMLLSGVDIDIRFGVPIPVQCCLDCRCIDRDVFSRESFDFDDPIQSRNRMRREALKIMQSYMSAIYDMTTVNHDHLFASILRRMPRRRFREMDLRRRVFLVASSEFKKAPVYRHSSLEENQIPLITDDRYRKFGDFMDLALEKSVVFKKNGWFRKDVSRFSSALDFNRARIDNPIAVMANEVEAIRQLQQRLRRVSFQPGWWIRRQTAAFLIKQQLATFQNDYQRFYHPDESKPKEICKPFLIKGKSGMPGVLLIHGYMSAPAEMKELADFLGRLGFWVYAVRLSGHGTAPEDLAERTYHEWIQSVDTGYGIISSLCRQVVVGGFSAGGGLALEFASRMPVISGVFSVSPPMRLRNPLSRLAPGIDAVNRSLRKVKIGGLSKSYIENHPENPGINYLRNPISGVHQLERLMKSLYEKLPLIQVPALVTQAKGDPVVDPRGSLETLNKIGSVDKSYVTFDFDRHGILLGNGAEKVHRTLGEFIKRVAT